MHRFYEPTNDSYEPNIFQIVDVVSADEYAEIDLTTRKNRHAIRGIKMEMETDGHNQFCPYLFVIRIFGVCSNGKRVMVKISDYKPDFYVSLHNVDEKTVESLIRRKGFYASSHFAWNRRGSANCRMMTNIVVQKRDDGYREEGKNMEQFLHVQFHTDFIRKRIARSIRKSNQTNDAPIDVLEDYIDPMIRFFHKREIQPFSWARVPMEKLIVEERESECDYEFHCSWMEIESMAKEMEGKIAPILTMSFDLECTSASGAFPIPTNPQDPIIQIGATVYRTGDLNNDTDPLRVIFCVKSTDSIEGVDVICSETEKDMLIQFLCFLRKLRPDIWTGYNINGFDFSYLYERIRIHNLYSYLHEVGCLKPFTVSIIRKELRSSAYGSQSYFYLDIPGQVSCDVMSYVKREIKYPSYKLDYVASRLLNMNKHDVSPSQIFEYYNQDSAKRKIIAEYCIQDCILCNRLIEKLMIILNCGQMANVCFVPLSWIIYKGQGAKGISVYTRFAKELGYLVPGMVRDENQNLLSSEESGYQGATVLNANTGIYMEPIAVNDFSSLYPSCVISHNLGRDTHLSNKCEEGVDVEVIKIDDKIHRFKKAKSPVDGDPTGRSILAQVCMYLLSQRKKYKKLMEKEQDSFKKSVLNSTQLAYKITCNSMYGLQGDANNPIRCFPVAESITAVGRSLLILASNTGRKMFPGTVSVYGDTDSVFFKFPVSKELESVEQRRQAIEMAKQVEKKVDSLLPYPHSFEFEKVYQPLIIFKKKRYVGPLYEKAETYKYIDEKGLPTKRRDYAPIMKEVYGATLNTILLEKDMNKALKRMKELVKNMLQGKMEDRFFILSKSLKSENEYKLPDQIAHLRLAHRMKERDPGNAPKNGDRIPFLFVKRSDKESTRMLQQKSERIYQQDIKRAQGTYRKEAKQLDMGDRIEHPDYARENGLSIDYLHYLNTQIKKPMNQLIGIIKMEQEPNRYKPLFEKMGQEKYEKYMDKELQKTLWNVLEYQCSYDTNNKRLAFFLK